MPSGAHARMRDMAADLAEPIPLNNTWRAPPLGAALCDALCFPRALAELSSLRHQTAIRRNSVTAVHPKLVLHHPVPNIVQVAHESSFDPESKSSLLENEIGSGMNVDPRPAAEREIHSEPEQLRLKQHPEPGLDLRPKSEQTQETAELESQMQTPLGQEPDTTRKLKSDTDPEPEPEPELEVTSGLPRTPARPPTGPPPSKRSPDGSTMVRRSPARGLQALRASSRGGATS